jgi:hypothetical protein
MIQWYFQGMTVDELKQRDHEPADLSPALRALWHDARGNWGEAHRIAQAIDDDTGAWVHAYLHRKEGDPGNAAYWYRRAGRPVATGTLEDEWTAIALTMLGAM